MDLIIVAFYTLCNDLLIQNGHQDDPRTKMSATKVMTTALSRSIGMFGDNQQMAQQLLKEQGYMLSSVGWVERVQADLHQRQ